MSVSINRSKFVVENNGRLDDWRRADKWHNFSTFARSHSAMDSTCTKYFTDSNDLQCVEAWKLHVVSRWSHQQQLNLICSVCLVWLHLRRKILPLCQNMTFLHKCMIYFIAQTWTKRVVQLWYGSSFLRLIYTKSSELCKYFGFFCVACEVSNRICVSNYL